MKNRYQIFRMGLLFLAVFASAGFLAAETESEIPSAFAPVFTPDGASVAFALRTEKKTTIAVVSSAGGAHRAIGSFEGPATPTQWFPDGQAVLVTDAGKTPGIWRVPADGSPGKRLCEGENPRLSPNGRKIAFLGGGRPQLLDIDSGNVTSLGPKTAEGWRVGDWWDDESLALLTGEGNLVTIRLSAPETPAVLVPHKTMVHCFIAAVCNSKRRLVAVASDDMQFADPNNASSIWVFDAEGKPAGKTIAIADKPRWTAAGTLFFSRRTEILRTDDFTKVKPVSKGEIWAVAPDGALLIVGRRDVDTNGDGVLNWLDACRLYRVPLVDGVAGPAQPLLKEKAVSAGEDLPMQKEDPVRGVQFIPAVSGDGVEYGALRAVCPRVDTVPKLDGVLDEPCWAAAEKITSFRQGAGGNPTANQTVIRMAYDDQYLYLAIRCEITKGEELRLNRQTGVGKNGHDEDVWNGESIELFFDAEHSHQRYFQIVVSPMARIFDETGQEFVSEYIDLTGATPRLTEKTHYTVDLGWDSKSEFAAGREEGAWTLEGRIPLSDFGLASIEEGAVWGFNACRNNCTTQLSVQSQWVPLKGGSYHAPRYFGHLVFGKPALTLSDVSWDTGHGQCRFRTSVKPEGAGNARVALRLDLVTDAGPKTLGSVEREVPAGNASSLDFVYALPEDVDEGKILLTASVDGKTVCRRAHFFSLGELLMLTTRQSMISSTAKSLDAALWLRLGEESRANAKAVIEARNLVAGKRYKREIGKLEGAIGVVALDPKVLGEGKGVIHVTVDDANGKTLGQALAPYEIIADPFTE